MGRNDAAVIHQAVHRLMDDSGMRGLQRRAASGGGAGSDFVELDVIETNDEFEVKASLPGVKPDDVNITIDDDTLTIEGESRQEEERQDGRYHRRERRFGSFSRTITLPRSVNTEACDASFEHGVLTITIPKATEGRRRQIPIGGQQRRSAQLGQEQSRGSTTPSAGSATSEQRTSAHQSPSSSQRGEQTQQAGQHGEPAGATANGDRAPSTNG